MITEKQYLKAKKVIAEYKKQQLNKPVVKRRKLPSYEWNGSPLPGHGSVARRFFPNM